MNKKLKGIYLVKRWIMDDDNDYEVAAYAVDENNKIHEGLSMPFSNTRRDLKYSKVEALESIQEESEDLDFDIHNIFSGKLKVYNRDGSKVKIVFEDIGGRDIRAGYPTPNLVKFYLRDNKKDLYADFEDEEVNEE